MQIPQIANAHDKIISNFIEGKYLQGQKCFKSLIGLDKEGWAIPYDIQVNIEYLNVQEMGISGAICRNKDKKMHIVISNDGEF